MVLPLRYHHFDLFTAKYLDRNIFKKYEHDVTNKFTIGHRYE